MGPEQPGWGHKIKQGRKVVIKESAIGNTGARNAEGGVTTKGTERGEEAIRYGKVTRLNIRPVLDDRTRHFVFAANLVMPIIRALDGVGIMSPGVRHVMSVDFSCARHYKGIVVVLLNLGSCNLYIQAG